MKTWQLYTCRSRLRSLKNNITINIVGGNVDQDGVLSKTTINIAGACLEIRGSRVQGSPWFNFSALAAFVNSQLACLQPIGIIECSVPP